MASNLWHASSIASDSVNSESFVGLSVNTFGVFFALFCTAAVNPFDAFFLGVIFFLGSFRASAALVDFNFFFGVAPSHLLVVVLRFVVTFFTDDLPLQPEGGVYPFISERYLSLSSAACISNGRFSSAVATFHLAPNAAKISWGVEEGFSSTTEGRTELQKYV